MRALKAPHDACWQRGRGRVEHLLFSLLGRLRYHIALIDRFNRILMGNIEDGAQGLCGLLRVRNGRLECAASAHQKAWDAALTRASGENLAFWPDAQTVLIVCFLKPSPDMPPDTHRVVLIRSPQAEALPGLESLQDIYGFSPAEARLALAYAQGMTLSEYAEHAQYKTSYIKKLSQRTLGKVNAKSRTELVRLIAGSVIGLR